ncbi:hypothetical protein C0992_001201 [Termitomyces sp. T32_za158]|nr:hypothetical protein C0992_001201 [Termitomyces sp. T32_za158]
MDVGNGLAYLHDMGIVHGDLKGIFVGEVPFAHIQNNAVVVLRVQSGARPKRPEASSPVWGVGRLTENVWSCMEYCWQREPVQRPSTKAIIQALATEIDNISHARMESRLSPAEFRRQMSEPVEMLTTDMLDNILELERGNGRKELETLDERGKLGFT